MSNILKLISRLRFKKLSPKVYAIVLMDTKNMVRYLWVGVDYTLEDATEKALQGAHESWPQDQTVKLWKPLMYDIIQPTELFEGFLHNEAIVMKQSKEMKNALMRQIIESRDKKLYQENRSKFSKEERLLLEEKLK